MENQKSFKLKSKSSLGFLSRETASTEVQSPTGDGVGGLGKVNRKGLIARWQTS